MEKLFRFHKGSLEESMKTQTAINDRDFLISVVKDVFGDFEELLCKYYAYDERINWKTYIISIKHSGGTEYPIGFTNFKL